MPNYNTMISLPLGPSGPSSRRRRPPPAPAKPTKPEKQPVPIVTRHYPVPQAATPAMLPLNIAPAPQVSPFPMQLPKMGPAAGAVTHASQDELTEEIWGPEIVLEPLPKKKGEKGKEKKNDKKKKHLKMCPTNGYQPRKDAVNEKGSKLQRAVSGSTEFITTYTVEKLPAGGGKRKTWVTWTRQVTVVEEKVVDQDGNVVDGAVEDGEGGTDDDDSDSSDTESEEEKGKKGKKAKGDEDEESSDDEYFNEKRCEWRPKAELKGKKGNMPTEEGKEEEK